MSNHPNRGRSTPAANPTTGAIRAIRESAGLTQSQAAALIYSTLRSWQAWEAGERRMHPQLFESFQAKAKKWQRHQQ